MNSPKAILHGECIIFEAKIPIEAKPEKIDGAVAIIANSEVTGNHHVIDMTPDIEFYQVDKKRYFKCSSPATVRCLMQERHDTVTLPPGEYGIDIQQEYDYFAQAKRNVAD
jgi:hypothetical protein